MRDVQVIESMVARDGVEPPTPAFSGLYSAVSIRLNAKAIVGSLMLFRPEILLS